MRVPVSQAAAAALLSTAVSSRSRPPCCAASSDRTVELSPRPDLTPQELPGRLMDVLMHNDFPEVDSGLRSMWQFASDTTRFLYKGNITEYIEDAHETADTLPTSFYGVAFFGKEYELEGAMTLTGSDHWIGTQVMKTVSSDGRLRRWQWELRRHRQTRCWYVESIGSSDRLGNFDIEG